MPLTDLATGFLGDDKFRHATAGEAINEVSRIGGDLLVPELVQDHPFLARASRLAPVAVAAVGKELWDRSHHGDPDWKDTAATIAGGLLPEMTTDNFSIGVSPVRGGGAITLSWRR